MSKFGQFLLGGLGGLLPVLATLVSLDIAAFAQKINNHEVTFALCLAYGLRTLASFILGGAVAWANRDVTHPLTLIQIGIAAPALVTSYLTGAVIAKQAAAERTDEATHSTSLFFSEAAASELDSTKEIVIAGAWDDFVNGLTPGLGANVKETEEDLRRPHRLKPDTKLYVINRQDSSCINLNDPSTFTRESLDAAFPPQKYKIRKGTCEEHDD